MNNRHKIAIIEDEPAINEMYRMKLDLEGFDVITAFNGEEGLALVKKHKPDLILLDIKMPVMSGDEMLEKLRSTEWGAKMRVVILTNISRDEAPHNLRLLHVDRYIVKAHYTPSQIVTLVREIIG
jgi:DNA-binding response OmpR family regulator